MQVLEPHRLTGKTARCDRLGGCGLVGVVEATDRVGCCVHEGFLAWVVVCPGCGSLIEVVRQDTGDPSTDERPVNLELTPEEALAALDRIHHELADLLEPGYDRAAPLHAVEPYTDPLERAMDGVASARWGLRVHLGLPVAREGT